MELLGQSFIKIYNKHSPPDPPRPKILNLSRFSIGFHKGPPGGHRTPKWTPRPPRPKPELLKDHSQEPNWNSGRSNVVVGICFWAGLIGRCGWKPRFQSVLDLACVVRLSMLLSYCRGVLMTLRASAERKQYVPKTRKPALRRPQQAHADFFISIVLLIGTRVLWPHGVLLAVGAPFRLLRLALNAPHIAGVY